MEASTTNQISNILKEIDRTGFPTEIVAAADLTSSGWATLFGKAFLDPSENTSRQLDLRSFRPISINESRSAGVYLLVECKKSTKPWVFFTTPCDEYERNERSGDLISSQSLKSTGQHLFRLGNFQGEYPAIAPDVRRQHHHYFAMERWARAYFEPFKNTQDGSTSSQVIYGALQTLVTANRWYEKNYPKYDDRYNLYYPVIVFDGEIYDAQVGHDKTVDLHPVDRVVVHHSFVEPTQSRFDQDEFSRLIDVVRASELRTFAEMVIQTHELMFASIPR